ncbi:hypothetical protein SXCC_01182 [Gluconacetobacter sp. SXCC-1]|nr:hypothetical protein SXCC_01182 [Gluconacetobacter sp. SXCC-1]
MTITFLHENLHNGHRHFASGGNGVIVHLFVLIKVTHATTFHAFATGAADRIR